MRRLGESSSANESGTHARVPLVDQVLTRSFAFFWGFFFPFLAIKIRNFLSRMFQKMDGEVGFHSLCSAIYKRTENDGWSLGCKSTVAMRRTQIWEIEAF